MSPFKNVLMLLNINFNILRFVFNHTYMSISVWVYGFMDISEVTLRGQKMVPDALELELQVVVNCST